MPKVIFKLRQQVYTEELKQMLNSSPWLADAFNRMMESEEVQAFLNEYLQALKNEALEEEFLLTYEMRNRFYEVIKEILLVEIYRDTISASIDDILIQGIRREDISYKMSRFILDDVLHDTKPCAYIIKNYLMPLRYDSKRKKKGPFALQKMLAIISTK